MAPELAPDIEVVEIKSPDSPEEVVAATRSRTGQALIGIVKILGVGAGAVVLAFVLQGCVDGKELEQQRQAIYEQTNSALCTIVASGPNPPSGEIDDIDSDQAQPIIKGPLDMAHVPTDEKKIIWKQYVFEKEADYQMGQGPHISIYIHHQDTEKEKIGQLQSIIGMSYVTPDGYVQNGSKVYQLQEIGGTVEDVEIGELDKVGPSTHKEGILIIKYIENSTIRKLAAINPANPGQTLKDIIIPSNESLSGESGLHYSDGIFAITVENKVLVYKDLPSGVDWMDNAGDYLAHQVEIDFAVQGIKVINGYTFVLNSSQIGVISPAGQLHTIHTDDINGSTFQSFERIGGRLHVVASPSFSIAPWPNPFNPTFPYLITEDPGSNSSNYSHCAATTPEYLSAMFPPINPDTIEDDAYVYDDVYDALEEIGVDTEIYPDIDPADVLPDTPIEDIPIEDVQPDTPIEDVQPDLPPPDVQPDTPADIPIEDVQPDLPPPDVQPDTPADIPIDTSFDIEDTDTPADLIQETFDTLDLLADTQFDVPTDAPQTPDTQFDEFTPDNKTPETIQPETTNPDVPADAPNPDTPKTDNKPDPQDNDEGDAYIEEETDPPKGGGNGCSTSDDPGSPLGPILVVTGMTAGAVAFRRKEDDPIPAPAKKAKAA